jgi:hypothetical protein
MPCFTTTRIANMLCAKCAQPIEGEVHVVNYPRGDYSDVHQDMFHAECCPEKESHA